MIKAQWMIVVLALTLCATTVEARGRRMVQQGAMQYYTTPQYTMTPTIQYDYNTVPAQPVQNSTNVVINSVNTTSSTNGIIQTSGVQPSNGEIVQASSVVVNAAGSIPASVPAVNSSAPGSAQWKAEQSARMGSVQHIGGGFGGGSFEGNGFGATPDQAVRNACYWGQRTPIQIGVARGANGYYATVFYR
jgi:hypothetical protein